ncbi:hypothetical protein OF001_U80162 [Pseudomonas sp. OF001]|nr:hypothetical protein OF001_U80162 [Pseudomonas sp. OF001]
MDHGQSGTQALRQTGRGPGISQGPAGAGHHRRRHGRPRHLRARLALVDLGAADRQDQKLRGAALPVPRLWRAAHPDG